MTHWLSTNILINPLNTQLNPTCHLLALLGAHHIFHVSRVRVKQLNEHISNLHLHIFNEEYNTVSNTAALYFLCVFKVLIFSDLTYKSSTILTSEQLLTSTALLLFFCCLTETNKIYHMHPFFKWQTALCSTQSVNDRNVTSTSQSRRRSSHSSINVS